MASDWDRTLRRTSLTITTALAAGTAAAAAAVVWGRSRQRHEDAAGSSVLSVLRSGSRGPSRRTAIGSITWAEVAEHDRLDDAWVVISGKVYNVTPFLEEHPGGKLLLLAFAGRDATEPFETVGHSALAMRELRGLHIGELNKVAPWTHQGGGTLKGAAPLRRAELTGGRKAPDPDKVDPLWKVQSFGFLPARDPVGIEALFGTVFEPFAEFCELLPALGFTGKFRQKLDGDPQLQARMLRAGELDALQELTDDQIERAFCVVGYTMIAYWRGGTLAFSSGVVAADQGSQRQLEGGSCGIDDTKVVLPAFLSKPMLRLSEHLKRPPMIDYASTVLYNWARIDKNGPITMSNVRCVVRLTGLNDEEWFFKTHVIIESEAAHAISAVIAACAADNDDELLNQLMLLEEAMWRVVRACLPIMYERDETGTPKCSEHIFYQILRPLIKSGPLTFDGDTQNMSEDGGSDGAAAPAPRSLAGPSGAMSSLLPAIDAACGIQMTSEKLRDTLGKFELSMPAGHREFLAEMRGTMSIRKRILLSRPVGGEPSEQHEALVRSFNRVISRVLDFRWQHWSYVKNFVMKPGNISHAVGTGGTTFDFLQQHITDTEKARIRSQCDGFSRMHSEPPELPPIRPPPDFAYKGRRDAPQKEFWSVDGDHGLLARQPLVSPETAPFSRNLSPPMLEAFQAVWNLALRIPALCAARGPFYDAINAASGKLAAMQDDRAVAGLSEVAREHLMTTLTHIAAGCVATGHKKPPRCVEKPLQVVARSVGRPPHMDFAELVLNNWNVSEIACVDRDDSQEEEQAANGKEVGPRFRHQVVWRFLAMPDEEWYRATHIIMHEEAREIVAAIRVGHVAMRDQNDIAAVSSMVRIGAWCNKFCDYFDAYFECKDSRTESVMVRRLEPFISHGGLHDLTSEETACWVYCMGSSVLLPALHAFFGVQMCPVMETDNPDVESLGATMRRTLQEARVFMPGPHREFIELLEKPGVSVRQYCFRRFGAKSVSVEVLHDLEAGYNDSLNTLVRFLSRRVHLVSRFFPPLAGTFGALNSDIEAAMQHSRLQLLKMRQRVFRSMQQ